MLEVRDTGWSASGDDPSRRGRPRWARHLRRGIALAGALAAYALLHACVVSTSRVGSSSMEPSLIPGDHVLVNRLVFGARVPIVGLRLPPLRDPRPGDVLVFRHPDAPRELHVKRCAAAPGGLVPMRRALVRVPDDMLFVLGDNLEKSSDSREWGFLPRALVVGKVERIVWSSDRRGLRSDRLLAEVR